MGNNDNNNIQAGNNSTSTVADQNTIVNDTLQDHKRHSEDTIGNNASQDHSNGNANREETATTLPKPKVGYVVVPYTKGLSESFKNICSKVNICTKVKKENSQKTMLCKYKIDTDSYNSIMLINMFESFFKIPQLVT